MPELVKLNIAVSTYGHTQALKDGSRLLSAYILKDGKTKIWVITEADRSVTTVLLPDDY